MTIYEVYKGNPENDEEGFGVSSLLLSTPDKSEAEQMLEWLYQETIDEREGIEPEYTLIASPTLTTKFSGIFQCNFETKATNHAPRFEDGTCLVTPVMMWPALEYSHNHRANAGSYVRTKYGFREGPVWTFTLNRNLEVASADEARDILRRQAEHILTDLDWNDLEVAGAKNRTKKWLTITECEGE